MVVALALGGVCSASVAVAVPNAARPGSGSMQAARSSATRTWIVRAGEPVQATIDRAGPGDLVVLRPGTHREALRITTPGLRIAAVGARLALSGRVPGPCGPDRRPAAVCIGGGRPVPGVVLAGLTVTDSAGAGVIADRAPGLVVWGVVVRRSADDGIVLVDVPGGRVRRVLSRGNRGAGLRVVGAASAGLLIGDSSSVANGVGLAFDDAGGVTVESGDLRANCVGVRAGASRPPERPVRLVGSVIRDKGRSCPPPERAPGGAAIVVAGPAEVRTERTRTVRNPPAG